MSLLNTPEVTPSRVLGLYRMLIALQSPVSEEQLGFLVWPISLRGQDENVHPFDSINLREMRELGLISVDIDGNVLPHPDLPEAVRRGNLSTVTAALRIIIPDLIMHGIGRNDDLAYAIAWYLCQNPLRSPWGKDDLPNAVKDQGADSLAGLINDTRFGTFRDWSCYLGFAWQHDSARGSRLQVDPSAHIRLRLRDILPETGHFEPIVDVLNRMAELIPVFDGGRFRRKIEATIGLENKRDHISATTSLAFLRLESERQIVFESRSDAEASLLSFGNLGRRVTHIGRTK